MAQQAGTRDRIGPLLVLALGALALVVGCRWGDPDELPHGQGDDDTGDDDTGDDDTGDDDTGDDDTGDDDTTGDDDSAGDDDTIDVWALDVSVVDAEYDRAHDLLVAVSTSPSQLHVIDPVGPSISSVDLALAPTALSIEPGGIRAVVGHAGWFSLVDLGAPSVVEEYDTSCDAFDIVAGGTSWVFIFPDSGGWEDLCCVELSTGLETPHIGSSIHEDTVARLHPNGYAVYGADNGPTPSDIEKYLIDLGPAEYWNDSPYDGQYAMDGDLWIADDGGRIVVRAGNAFLAVDDPSLDMTYAGSLPAISPPLAWVEHSAPAARVFAVTEADDPQLWSFAYDDLSLVGQTPLPAFEVEDGEETASYDSAPRFAFASADGSWIHLLVQAVPENADADWGLLSLETATLP